MKTPNNTRTHTLVHRRPRLIELKRSGVKKAVDEGMTTGNEILILRHAFLQRQPGHSGHINNNYLRNSRGTPWLIVTKWCRRETSLQPQVSAYFCDDKKCVHLQPPRRYLLLASGSKTFAWIPRLVHVSAFALASLLPALVDILLHKVHVAARHNDVLPHPTNSKGRPKCPARFLKSNSYNDTAANTPEQLSGSATPVDTPP